MTGSRVRPGWALWSDWCTAAGHDEHEVTAAALRLFLDEVDVSARCLAELLSTARAQGTLQTGTPDPWRQVERGFEPLEACLRQCPIAGWTTGYRGRRDAWLLVLTRGLRLTRAEALAVAPGDLMDDWTVRGRSLAQGDDPVSCPRCVAARWLACREEEDRFGRSAVRQLLATGGSHDDAHDCVRRGAITTGLPAWLTLAPALDRYGWISSGYDLDPRSGAASERSMTPRGLTRVLALRCLPGAGQTGGGCQDEPDTGDDELALRRREACFDETTLDRLEAACDRADEVLARVAAALADESAKSPQHHSKRSA